MMTGAGEPPVNVHNGERPKRSSGELYDSIWAAELPPIMDERDSRAAAVAPVVARMVLMAMASFTNPNRDQVLGLAKTWQCFAAVATIAEKLTCLSGRCNVSYAHSSVRAISSLHTRPVDPDDRGRTMNLAKGVRTHGASALIGGRPVLCKSGPVSSRFLVAAARDEPADALGPQRGDDTRGATAPIEAAERGAGQTQRIEKVEQVFAQRGLLAGPRRLG
jgi:hypothetical protein